MSNKNKATVMVYRPRGGDQDPTTGRLTPYYDTYTQCEVLSWSYSQYNPIVIFNTTDEEGKTIRVTAVGMPYTIVGDFDTRD